MDQKFSLDAAGALFGISANAMRSRAKKYPDRYKSERDNTGKIWVWIDPENIGVLKASNQRSKGSSYNELKASIDAIKEQAEALVLAANARADLLEHQLDDTRADRDCWRDMAEKLANKPRRRWWPW